MARLSSVDLQNIEIEGYLKKQGPSKLSAWKQRYCILHSNGRFKYYASEEQREECGDVMITDITDVKREENKIIVETVNRIWRFEAEDENESLLWKKHFARLKRKKRSFKSEVTCQGWLEKRGGSVKNWKKRWCVLLDDGTFRYYGDESMTDQKKHDVCLKDIIEIGEDGDEFWAHTANRQWHFKTNVPEHRELWLEAFRNFLINEAGDLRTSIRPKFSLSASEPNSIPGTLSSSSIGSHSAQMSENLEFAKRLVAKTDQAHAQSESLASSSEDFEQMCKMRSKKMAEKNQSKSMWNIF